MSPHHVSPATASATDTLDALIDRIQRHAAEPRDQNDAASPEFIRAFYRGTSEADLQRLAPEEAARLAAACRGFLNQRTPGKPALWAREVATTLQGDARARTHLCILNDDMPFLLDSLSMELKRQGFTIHHVIHPILTVERDDSGALVRVHEGATPVGKGQTPDAGAQESLIVFEITRLADDATRDALMAALEKVLAAIRLGVRDWRRMLARVDDTMAHLSESAACLDPAELAEARDFLVWLRNNNFVFLGYVEYAFQDVDGTTMLQTVPDSELGIFGLHDLALKPRGLEALPPSMLHFAKQPRLIEITKSNRKSIIHRPSPMDYVAVKRFDAEGNVVGERRFLGLFTSVVYFQSVEQIPYVRLKARTVLERANFAPASHDGKALKTILEFLPRDELFQIDAPALYETAMGILSLEMRPRARLFVRKDVFERFVSCLAYAPREGFSTDARMRVAALLCEAYGGELLDFYTQIGDSPLARVHYFIGTTPGAVPNPDVLALEEQLAVIARSWRDDLRNAALRQHGQAAGTALFERYAEAFPAAYAAVHDPAEALADMDAVEAACASGALHIDLQPGGRPRADGTPTVTLRLFSVGEHLALSDILPLIEHMGLRVIDELPYRVTPKDRPAVSLREVRLEARGLDEATILARRDAFAETLARAFTGEVENDTLNALVLHGGLHWRDVVILRALTRYLVQARFTYSLPLMEETLARRPRLAAMLVELFHRRFDPDLTTSTEDRAARIAAQVQALEAALEDVDSVADDRIIRRLMEVMQATLRTNAYQTAADGTARPYVSFKLDSARIPELPLPVPFRDVFVYAPDVEGIHLRGGKVARGGLRWSDRREDFRTEILGLMKAQMVKNAVIVPVGAKGGFVLKRPPTTGGREALQKEGVRCYRMFLSGLLDITDNLDGTAVHTPPRVVRHDDDDPYLVVAADKGTATFSDIANAVAAEYGFWLGDAFASGGSAGYDHKKMGITARGGWVSVERHFREMGRSMDTPFTVVGIGDMAGDVFGNGMLLSSNIQLVGAFNHQHIFIDPDPDPAASFAERQRLFALPRSSWADYTPAVLSPGAAIFERQSKMLTLSPEAMRRFGLTQAQITPEALIRTLLTAEVDLLWNGGIGTYVKATAESHDDVGDRANNAVRVDGRDVRARVVGEGGNLGLTQRGRIEYARFGGPVSGGVPAGGRINTDAIDNSAGVDCSDHEVNIKIALKDAIRTGDLPAEAREALLADMTDDVARLVLRDNELQTLSLSVSETRGFRMLESQSRLMRALERRGLLNRAVEYLPDTREMGSRQQEKTGLTRPELAVLLAYSKLALSQDLINTSLPDDPYFTAELQRYFPPAMREQFAGAISRHRLRHEIVCTVLTNSMVNRVGSTFFNDIVDETGQPADDIARAYVACRDVFRLRDLWNAIEKLDGISTQTQYTLFLAVHQFVQRSTRWFLRQIPAPLPLAETVAAFQPGIAAFDACMEDVLGPLTAQEFADQRQQYLDAGVPAELARRVAGLDAMASAADITLVARDAKLPFRVVAQVYFALGHELRLGWLRRMAAQAPVESRWQRLSLGALTTDVLDQLRRLTAMAIQEACTDDTCNIAVSTWLERHRPEITRYLTFMEDLRTHETLDLAMLVTAVRKVQELVVR